MTTGALSGPALFLLVLSLIGCGPKGPDIAGRKFSVWVDELNDVEPHVRRQAAQKLAQAGAAAEPAVPYLIPMLSDKDMTVRTAAAGALSGIGKGAVPALTKAVKSDDVLVRCGAAVALIQIDPKNAEVTTALLEAAALGKDIPKDFRAHAHIALGKIGPAAVPALIEGLKHKDIEIRRRAAGALGETGPAAKAAVPLLKEMAANRSDEAGQKLASDAIIKITGSGERFTEK